MESTDQSTPEAKLINIVEWLCKKALKFCVRTLYVKNISRAKTQ